MTVALAGITSNVLWNDQLVPAASAVVKATPGQLWSFVGIWTKDDPRWLLFFDLAILPAEGAVPLMCGWALTAVPNQISNQPGADRPLQASYPVAYSFPRFRRFPKNGIAWAVSNTPNVLSFDSSALLSLSVEYS
jgi:hypothetical protein